VSFDVVSLFTSIPIPLVLVIISDLLSSDSLLHERTKLTVNDVLSSLELCFRSTIFAFNNTLYRQIFDTPMGTCILPIVANIFMEHIERLAVTSFRDPPRIWI